MSEIGISFSESALSDLQGILEWYADEGVTDLGERFVAEVFKRVEALARYPDLGRVVPEFGQTFLRAIIHPPLRIVYRRDANRIRVVRVWRSERLLRLPKDETRLAPKP